MHETMPASLALFQQALFFAFKMSLLLALVGACAGVAFSVLLSAFQIQDPSLPFVVKLVVVGVALAVCARPIAAELLRLVDNVFARTALLAS
ncbi:hypothetical protein Busp01_24210 [Trinickia caryophylli]|uniref:Type III secretory pathway, component EscS n=2 Tax=Trinickia caryophylli TaxID=28094 RepID=A0A1X7DZ18_TRICW|nr:flagellar biosynthetic protein FliQ [Trinickia caryophylli]PMS14116.1 EscS/YscS/HrcS family type III secretion system export apparatus protein [Trinickia caryophylli]TRX17815.1 flagellar biosynthetic protein FliQ [Trinickia caryophylli]GLU32579.1 hypothetical protein Busp01_24210 [Trinickia caryophylli]SMF24343.1 Type III secretory pathway, component EscS [Trinickia caryophylli]